MSKHIDLFTAKKRALDDIKKEQKKLKEMVKELDTKVTNSKLSSQKWFSLISAIESQKETIKKLIEKIRQKEKWLENIWYNLSRTFYTIYQTEKDDESYRRYNFIKNNIQREIKEIEKITKYFKEKFEYIVKYS